MSSHAAKSNMNFLKKMMLDFFILFLLTIIVLLVNMSVIQFSMLYPEQPILYIANQKIASFWDLANVYLHPQMMHYAIPFFRPSGHFLIYQLLTPLLGWHNTQAFIIVNLLFLSMSGSLILRIYELLFPSYKWGGYIAFSIYLMHPALALSRLITLHFEFAYVFFLLLSLYYFLIFCKNNQIFLSSNSQSVSQIKLSHFGWLSISLFFYMLAVTFKEPAVMLGPVLGVFLLIGLYQPNLSMFKLFRSWYQNKPLFQLLLLLTIFSISLLVYLSLSWPSLSNLQRNPFETVSYFFQFVIYFLFNINFTDPANNVYMLSLFDWRIIRFPLITTITIWILSISSLISCFLVFKRPNENIIFKKSLFFLFVSALFFILLPMAWGMALPWHFSLTILMLSLIMGFGCEYLIMNRVFCLAIAIFIAFQAYPVNQMAINVFAERPDRTLGFKLLNNAISHPPKIKHLLQPNSLIVIEDSIIQDWYVAGAGGFYPFLVNINSNIEFVRIFKKNYYNFIPPDPNFNGSLFRFAYLMPDLSEQPYPFQINKMNEVDKEMIYQWLLHYDNIFCLGYDEKGNWYDRTSEFKKNLLREKFARDIQVNPYQNLAFQKLTGEASHSGSLPYSDSSRCQYACDQDASCRGFTFYNYALSSTNKPQCVFYRFIEANKIEPCPICTAYKKA